MSKICLLLFSLLFLPGMGWAREWNFNVSLDGKPIGEHRFVLDESGNQKLLSSEARFNVKFLFINAYQYLHKANEKWQGACLSELDATTHENGTTTLVKGRLEKDGFKIDASRGRESLPACVMTFAYWNPKILEQSRLLNPQTGEWLALTISNRGTDTLQVRGKQTKAEHYFLDAVKLRIDLWYSPEGEWLGLKSTTPEGRIISYQLR